MKNLQLSLLLIFISLSCSSQEVYKNYNASLPSLMNDSTFNNLQLFIVINKSEYKLTILADTLIVKEYPVVFGGNPKDNKLMQGDQCTPEGKFKIRSKYPHKSWSKFIWLDYPNEDSWAKHNQAKSESRIPQQANIGGEIGIHGVPEGMDY